MASTNFKIFAESVDSTNLETDNEYETDTQRMNGVVPGIAVPKMHNKLYKQATIMAAAIAQVIVQAGFDAMDSDYTGLVANLRKTFAGSVNGVKPDENGNIDISEVLNEIRNLTIPRVGDAIITKNGENPGNKWKGTEWELLKEETFIMSAGTNTAVNSTGGSNNHVNIIDEMPAHTHGAVIGNAGAHDHDRGTMNITGSFTVDDRVGNGWGDGAVPSTGAFYPSGDCNYDAKSHTGDGKILAFDASRSWTGRTSIEGGHTHAVSISSVGAGKKWDSRPKYIAMYIWIRTK